MTLINYLHGDATAPSSPGSQVIVHVCNDVGAWGRGFVLALSHRWPQPEASYRAWFRDRATNDFALGAVQFVQVEPNLWVANLVGQHGLRRAGSVPPIRLDAIQTGLRRVRQFAEEHAATVHMPRIGCGLAGGRWDQIQPLVEAAFGGVEVFVYDP